jgi:hypothetical protein
VSIERAQLVEDGSTLTAAVTFAFTNGGDEPIMFDEALHPSAFQYGMAVGRGYAATTPDGADYTPEPVAPGETALVYWEFYLVDRSDLHVWVYDNADPYQTPFFEATLTAPVSGVAQ